MLELGACGRTTVVLRLAPLDSFQGLDMLRTLSALIPGLLFGWVGSAFGQGDDCGTATAISAPGAYWFDTAPLTTSGFDGTGTCTGDTIFNDGFFLWTAPVAGNYKFDTWVSSVGTRLAVHAGIGCSAVCIEYNDLPTALESEVTVLGVAAGDILLIQVGTSASSLNAFMPLNVRYLGPPSVGSRFCSNGFINSTGGPSVLLGSLNGIQPGLHLEVTGGPPGELGYILVGTGVDPAPSIMLGNGLLCLDVFNGHLGGRYNIAGGTLNSIGLFDTFGVLQNLAGTSSVGSGFDVPEILPFAGLPMIAAGQTLHFQGWLRDTPAGIGQSNATTGFSYTFL
ncbi:MAG: hypothetical protein ACI9X4_001558 [Glaciecola sp.]|jgi:hypothetical protein